MVHRRDRSGARWNREWALLVPLEEEQAHAARGLRGRPRALPGERRTRDRVAASDLGDGLRLQRQPIEPAMRPGDVAGSEADARQPLALRGKHRANTVRIRGLAAWRPQFQPRVVELRTDESSLV